MAKNPRLDEAVAVFAELGWAHARPADAPTLPLGTPEQREVALAGLSTGDWFGMADGSLELGADGMLRGGFRYRSLVGVSEARLALFAVRVGVDGRRAADLLAERRMALVKIGTVAIVVEQRGPRFAKDFVRRASTFAVWQWRYPSVLVGLVARFGLPVPQQESYLQAWSRTVGAVLSGEQVDDGGVLPVLGDDRFAEHVQAAAAAGLLVGDLDRVMVEGVARGWLRHEEAADLFAQLVSARVTAAPDPELGPVLARGVARGWLDRETALDLALSGLDAATRPADRTTWSAIWSSVGATDADAVARVDALVPVLATGDNQVVERFAPALVAGVDDDMLADVATVALTATTKKARRVVLAALAARPRPSDATADAVGPQVTALGVGADRTLARAVAQVVDRWGLTPEEPAAAAVQGWWQPVPPVWQVPRFDHGPLTPEALTETAAELLARSAECDVVDVVVERFLVVAVAVARDDLQVARSALRGLPRQSGAAGVAPAAWWAGVAHEPARPAATGTGTPVSPIDAADRRDPRRWDAVDGGFDRLTTSKDDGLREADLEEAGSWWHQWLRQRASDSPLWARDVAVIDRLGQVPCVLSEPSWVDLRIDPADLVARLRAYADAGVAVGADDLTLALTRLDVALADDAVHAALDALAPVPVLVRPGQPEVSAGAVVRQYLADRRAGPDPWPDARPATGGTTQPDSPVVRFLGDAAARVRRSLARRDVPWFAVFPTWQDASPGGPLGARRLVDLPDRFDSAAGVLLRQVVRRAVPLPPDAVASLMVAQRSVHPRAAADVARAAAEAWERGLLRPGVADVRRLEGVPRGAVALALGDLAREGMLAVVWPVLDDLLVEASSARRLPAGTADVAQAVADLLPEVLAAVACGAAEPSALDLPGARALAAWGGSSASVRAARGVVAQLPEPTVAPSVPHAVAATPVVPFDEAWPTGAGTLPAVVDDATLTAGWVDPSASTKMLWFDVALPDHPDERFRVIKGWTYDLENEGQCQATRYQVGTEPLRPGDYRRLHDAWLSWDATACRLTVAAYRSTAGVSALSTTLVAVVLGLVAQDGDAGAAGERLVTALVGKDLRAARQHGTASVRGHRIGAAAVRVAVGQLLTSPDVSPARLVRVLEKHPTTLPTLWPLLTEPVRAAGAAEGPPPRWLARVLDAATLHAPTLREAARRGLLPPDAAAWPGLADLAARPGRSATPAKARALLVALDLEP